MKRVKCNKIKIVKEGSILELMVTGKGGAIKNIKITRDKNMASNGVLFVDGYIYKIKGNRVKELEFTTNEQKFLFTTNTNEEV